MSSKKITIKPELAAFLRSVDEPNVGAFADSGGDPPVAVSEASLRAAQVLVGGLPGGRRTVRVEKLATNLERLRLLSPKRASGRSRTGSNG